MNEHLRISGLTICGALLLSGCAGGPGRDGSSWLNLPSPWKTVKDSETQSKTAARSNASPVTNTASSSAKKSAKDAGKNEESLTMTVLRGRNCERSGDWDKARQIYEGL